jgi:ribosomal protein S17E
MAKEQATRLEHLPEAPDESKNRREQAQSSAQVSAVDRLIELASDKKSAPQPPLAIQKSSGSDSGSMWKVLGQLKSVLPYLSRLLPLLDSRLLPLLDMVGMGHAQSAGLSKEIREEIAGIQTSHREILSSAQEQSVEVKRLGDRIAQLQEDVHRSNFEHGKLVEEVKSLGQLLRIAGAVLGVLLIVLILMAGFLLAHAVR